MRHFKNFSFNYMYIVWPIIFLIIVFNAFKRIIFHAFSILNMCQVGAVNVSPYTIHSTTIILSLRSSELFRELKKNKGLQSYSSQMCYVPFLSLSAHEKFTN